MPRTITSKPNTGDKYHCLEVLYTFFQRRSMVQVKCTCGRVYAISCSHWGKIQRCKTCNEAKKRHERVEQRLQREEREQRSEQSRCEQQAVNT